MQCNRNDNADFFKGTIEMNEMMKTKIFYIFYSVCSLPALSPCVSCWSLRTITSKDFLHFKYV